MSNENYVNYYVEILTNTMTDAVVRNVSLQTNAKITEEVITNLQQAIEDQNKVITSLQEELESFKQEKEEVESQKIIDLNNTIVNLTDQITELNALRVEYENGKHQIQHIDTFRNELVRVRNENDEMKQNYENQIKLLNDKIEYLQLSPAKRKKVDEQTSVSAVDLTTKDKVTTIEDGGTF